MPPKGIHVPIITVTPGEASHLIRCLTSTADSIKKWYSTKPTLIDYKNKAIRISLDSNWRPFTGFTLGLIPEDEKVYLPNGIMIIETVAELLKAKNLDIPGGRIFINKHLAFHKVDGQKKTLCTCDWKGDNPYRAISKKFLYW